MSALRVFFALSLVACSREEPPFASPATSSSVEVAAPVPRPSAPEPSPSAAPAFAGELPSSPEYLVSETDAPVLAFAGQPADTVTAEIILKRAGVTAEVPVD